MEIIGLVSGGKDSLFNLWECVRLGHRVVALGNLCPEGDGVEELDSHMFQTVGHGVVPAIAEAMGVPLYRRATRGLARVSTLDFSASQLAVERDGRGVAATGAAVDADEIDDLHALLATICAAHHTATGVACGAILSTYQRVRVEAVAQRLHLTPIAMLWQRDQSTLLREMVSGSSAARAVERAPTPSSLNMRRLTPGSKRCW